MGLKAFHLVFIVASDLLAFLFGSWCLRAYSDFDSAGYLVGGLLSFVVGVGLAFYLAWFLKKLRGVSYFALAAGLLFASDAAQACAVCVGNPNSPLTISANQGVLFLMGVIGVVLAVFAGIFLVWAKRSQQLELRGF